MAPGSVLARHGFRFLHPSVLVRLLPAGTADTLLATYPRTCDA